MFKIYSSYSLFSIFSISEVNIDPKGHVFLVLLHVAKELNSQLDQQRVELLIYSELSVEQ
jgi:hypothetical protein